MKKISPKFYVPPFVRMGWDWICNNIRLTGIILILIVGIFVTLYFAVILFSEDTWRENILFPIALMVTEVALIGVVWHLIAQTNFFRNQLAEVLYGDYLKGESLAYIENRWKQVTGHMVEANFNYLKEVSPETYDKVKKEIVDKYFGAIDYYIYKEVREISIDSIELDPKTGKRTIKSRESTKLYLIPATPKSEFFYEKHMRCSLGDKITLKKFKINGKDVKGDNQEIETIYRKKLLSNAGIYEVEWETEDDMVFGSSEGSWIFLTRREFAIDSTIMIEHGEDIETKMETKVPYNETSKSDSRVAGTSICKDSWHNSGVDFPGTTVAVLIQDRQYKQEKE